LKNPEADAQSSNHGGDEGKSILMQGDNSHTLGDPSMLTPMGGFGALPAAQANQIPGLNSVDD